MLSPSHRGDSRPLQATFSQEARLFDSEMALWLGEAQLFDSEMPL